MKPYQAISISIPRTYNEYYMHIHLSSGTLDVRQTFIEIKRPRKSSSAPIINFEGVCTKWRIYNFFDWNNMKVFIGAVACSFEIMFLLGVSMLNGEYTIFCCLNMEHTRVIRAAKRRWNSNVLPRFSQHGNEVARTVTGHATFLRDGPERVSNKAAFAGSSTIGRAVRTTDSPISM